MFPKWVTIKTHPRKKRCWFTPAKKNNNKYKSNNKNSHEKFFEFDASTKKKQHENQSAIAKNKFLGGKLKEKNANFRSENV